METKPYSQLIPRDEIPQEFPYGLRFNYRDDFLGASLKKRGMLFPVLLSADKGEEKLTMISGHKRFFAAVRLGFKEIPAMILDEELSPKELFILSLYSNEGKQLTELDRMIALKKAENDFGFTPQELKEEIFPLLGITLHQKREYQEVSGLAKELHLLIDQKKLPFHGTASLARFSHEEQVFLARNLFENLHLTCNQLMQTSEWLKDLQRLKKIEVAKILTEENLSQVLQHPQMDPRTRGERFFQMLWALRFPRISKKEKDFQKLKAKLASSNEISVQHPEGFEAQGLVLRAQLKRKGIAGIIRYLEDHKTILENFLEE